MIALRPYQICALNVLQQLHRRHGAGIVMLPTGTGKTILGLAIAKHVLDSNKRVLWLAHRDELISQTIIRCASVGITDVGVVKAEADEHNAGFVCASVQTLSRPERLARLNPTFGLIVIDEAHHVGAISYQRIIDVLKTSNTTLVGLTATPFRHDNINLGNVFTDGIVYSYQIIEAIADGYLVDLDWQQLPTDIDLFSVGLSNGDFSTLDLETVLLHCNIPEIVYNGIQSYAYNRRCVIYTPSVRTAHAVNDYLQNQGLSCAVITSETPLDERRAILIGCESGTIQRIVNCAILTEGWDCPPMDCAIIARPTRSEGLYRQMVGRILRPWPTKDQALVLDVTPRDLHNARGLITAPVLFGVDPTKSSTIKKLSSVQSRELFISRIKAPFRWTPSWVRIPNAYGAPAGDLGLVVVVKVANGLWQTALVNRQDVTLLGQPTDHDLAIGVALDAIRRAKNLARQDAKWRQEPPSENQLKALAAWHVTQIPTSKGHASDLLNTAILQAALPKIYLASKNPQKDPK